MTKGFPRQLRDTLSGHGPCLLLGEPKTSESGCRVCSQQGPCCVAVLPGRASVSPLLGAGWLRPPPSSWSCVPQEGDGTKSHPIPLRAFQERHAQVTNPSLPPLPTAGWILIDRCGKHFGTILNYLRDGAVPLPESRREIEELLAEAKYYLVQGLVEECQVALQVGVPPPSLTELMCKLMI